MLNSGIFMGRLIASSEVFALEISFFIEFNTPDKAGARGGTLISGISGVGNSIF